ncbi:hypothetical protein H257_18457 [Aphanomyces astaci]|uniref:Uncharacterized protein n=1 Tax=Aphanomyces astaci TaxID=112090 RepID=W4FCQ9_APHAT|nr:hypothetical protein H257_18457 [Aphanomyces astaci]ETV64679.1 hypothetical protein H257_18457 [Aphanomyces astaci]|eukprot:XP_009845814.1 hypothetical protein H257_18457 [Aphanomyces astaci]
MVATSHHYHRDYDYCPLDHVHCPPITTSRQRLRNDQGTLFVISNLMPPKKKANTSFQDVTRMVATAENTVLRIWSAPHQIGLVVKQAAECVADGT